MKKTRGWKFGVIYEDLVGFGYTLKKGSVVSYNRKKAFRDKDGFLLTQYEWWYSDETNTHLIRTSRRIIEGLPVIKEPYL